MSYDLTKVQVNDVLPAGSYAALVTSIDKKQTKSGTGEYYQVELTVTTQGANGRKIWDNFNTKNDNQTAVQIGLAKLKSLAIASGIPETKLSSFDPTMLANKEVKITTTIKKDDTYGDKAEIKKYSSLTDIDKSTITDNIPF